MLRSLYTKNLFARLFSLGLFLMVLDAVKEYLNLIFSSNILNFNVVSFSAIGIIICLISFPFLMVEWLVSPLGTQAKRIKFYQGSGNILALAMLVAGWFWREDSSRQFAEVASMTMSSGGLIIALIFASTGNRIASFISKKRIQLESFSHIAHKSMTKSSVANSSVMSTKLSSGNLINGVSSTPLTQLTQN